jgi:hypothetical protein
MLRRMRLLQDGPAELILPSRAGGWSGPDHFPNRLEYAYAGRDLGK